MKGIAIGLSNKSKVILKRLKKTKFIDEIYIASSIGASIRLINSFLTTKEKDPGVIVIDKKGSRIIPIVGAHQSNTQNIAFQISNLFGGEIIETNN